VHNAKAGVAGKIHKRKERAGELKKSKQEKPKLTEEPVSKSPAKASVKKSDRSQVLPYPPLVDWTVETSTS